MGYVLLTLSFWLLFLRAVPRSDWVRYYPHMLFGGLLGTISDLVGVTTFQWHYFGPTTQGLSLWSDIGVAPAESALFLWSMRRFPRFSWLLWAGWTLGNTLGEWFFVGRRWIGYGYWHPFKAFLFYVAFFFCIRLHKAWFDRLEAMA